MTSREIDRLPAGERWARFRLEVIGGLLAAPPKSGELSGRIRQLAETEFEHPSTGEPVSFGFSTIERWYYEARGPARDPIAALKRRTRSDAGQVRAISDELRLAIADQHAAHPRWSYRLHYDNLAAEAASRPELGRLPSYSTIHRYMSARGLRPDRRRGAGRRTFRPREVRSFECEHPNSLWHLDFHHGSRKVLGADGQWSTPILLAILDDHSRLICHAQWYLDETSESLVHGLGQAILKWGLPRELLSDNGAAMLAGETVTGLSDLGVIHRTTLPYSPHQNGKQEVLWSQVEGRLLALLEHYPDLDLGFLNRATLAWVEQEYNRKVHSETRSTPIDRFISGDDVGRPAPAVDLLRRAFTTRATRRQRSSDGTISLDGVRFEIPNRLRPMRDVVVRYARWDLSAVDLIDPMTGQVIERIRPLDRQSNSDGRRRTVAPITTPSPEVVEDPEPLPALLRTLLEKAAATGLPPAYIPKHEPRPPGEPPAIADETSDDDAPPWDDDTQPDDDDVPW